jgi:charged multivesicular body protein 7
MSLLYNVNGVIAGIQMNSKISELLANGNAYKFDQVFMFQKNKILNDEVFSLTAYFTEPSSICDTSSAKIDLSDGSIGDHLYFQDGTSSQTSFEVPKNRQTALASGWNNNNCFPGMGWHTWYKSEELESSNCTLDRPLFLLFNKKQELLGFGFNVIGTAMSASNRYEHPPLLAVKTIMGKPPQCLIDSQKKLGLTTMHVFLVDYTAIPNLIDCGNPF